MSYEHPLAYVLGLEGLALLRGFTDEYDREFVEARLAEVRRLVNDESLAAAIDITTVTPGEGYRVWSRFYDVGHNTAFDMDEPAINEIIAPLPAGMALDAACGTGRWAENLAGRGHQVIGVDASPEMLAQAKTRVPQADFRLGDLRELPVDDNAVDLVLCTLALTHAPDLDPIFAEFARVLRPGGHLVVSDMHPESVLRGWNPRLPLDNGDPGRVASYRHLVGDYLRAALPVGLQPRRCVEPTAPRSEPKPPSNSLGPWEVWPWSVSDVLPEAARAANAGVPVALIWDFQH
ncbi:MAG TPA: methyltransferase domain-containing protein [Pseudonocardiaceae bacterium]|nr:methyltransferase domain-containing protein [Pseudonocardiaceae bacterium]